MYDIMLKMPPLEYTKDPCVYVFPLTRVRGYFRGVVSGRFPDKVRDERGCFIVIANSNHYPRKGVYLSPR